MHLQHMSADRLLAMSRGDIDPEALVALGFDRVEIRTRYSPSVSITLGGPSDPANEALARDVQPAIIFTGRAGRVVLAPYGVPEEGLGTENAKKAALQIGAGIAAGLVGLLLFGGSLFSSR